MTTVVYDHNNGLIAVDSLATAGSIIKSSTYDKTIRNELGLWIFSGHVSDVESMTKLNHHDKSDVYLDCASFLIVKESVFVVSMGKDCYCIHSKITFNEGLGSGQEFAQAALDFGKTAREAVEYAITKDIYTGGKVRVFNLKGVEVE